MNRSIHALAAAAMAVGFVASACGSTSDSGATTTAATAGATTSAPAATTTTSPAAAPAPADAADLQSLVPTPGDVQQTFGLDAIADNGIHVKFAVSGAPGDVMSAYKAALESKGWSVTTIVSSTGGGGGGATYTGANGDAYGVFDGGGFDTTTYLNVCAWPSQPADPNCSRSN